MLNINPVNNVIIPKMPAFRANSTQQIETIYNTVPNELKGNEALAVYNIGMVNNHKNLEIPSVEPRLIETDVNKIKGEKIYNSKGELLKIINENNDIKQEYFIKDNIIATYKETNKNNNEIYVAKYDNEGLRSITNKCKDILYSYDYDSNGNLFSSAKSIYDRDGNELAISYNSKDQEYHVSKFVKTGGDIGGPSATFDKNKKCISVDNIDSKSHTFQYVDFYNNQPYKITKRSEKLIPNNIDVKDINLENLEPHTYKGYNLEDVKHIDGKKRYYSNGNLEKVVTSDGTEYKIDLDERFFTVTNANKEAFFEKDESGEWTDSLITEKMDNGVVRETHFYKDGNVKVFYETDNIKKSAEYYPNGNLKKYTEDANGFYKGREFDAQGNLIDVWDGKIDD